AFSWLMVLHPGKGFTSVHELSPRVAGSARATVGDKSATSLLPKRRGRTTMNYHTDGSRMRPPASNCPGKTIVGGLTVDRGVRSEMKVKLVVIRGKPAGKTVEFPTGEYYFGRGKECQVRSNNEWISRQHCLLRVTSDGVFLRDLASRNGTLVNGVLLSEEL